MTGPGLIADIGGTNARFALVAPGGHDALEPQVFSCADFSCPTEAARAYLSRVAPAERPTRAAFAVASAVLGDEVQMTNHAWRFSVNAVRNDLGLDRLDVVNDFTAVALSVPLLSRSDMIPVGGGTADPSAPIAVLGPGTGLGVAGLVPTPNGYLAIPTEGGHVTIAAADEHEARVIAWLRSRFGHVSAERVLSGPGLVNLHCALRGLSGLGEEIITPAELSRRALSGEPLAREALEMFFAMLGTVAGNLALSLGARGGVVIAGGIVPQLLPAFLASNFRRRFEEKGRFDSYLSAIPVQVAIHPYPAFVGLAGLIGG
jgi:glucokinase